MVRGGPSASGTRGEEPRSACARAMSGRRRSRSVHDTTSAGQRDHVLDALSHGELARVAEVERLGVDARSIALALTSPHAVSVAALERRSSIGALAGRLTSARAHGPSTVHAVRR